MDKDNYFDLLKSSANSNSMQGDSFGDLLNECRRSSKKSVNEQDLANKFGTFGYSIDDENTWATHYDTEEEAKAAALELARELNGKDLAYVEVWKANEKGEFGHVEGSDLLWQWKEDVQQEEVKEKQDPTAFESKKVNEEVEADQELLTKEIALLDDDELDQLERAVDNSDEERVESLLATADERIPESMEEKKVNEQETPKCPKCGAEVFEEEDIEGWGCPECGWTGDRPVWESKKEVNENESINEQEPDVDLPEKPRVEPEEEPAPDAPLPPEEVKEPEKPMEMKKEYLGKAEDTHYYFLTVEGGAGDIEDFVITDQEGVKKYSAIDKNIEVVEENIADFIINAIRDLDIAQIERSIFMKYIYPKLIEKAPEEEVIEEPEEKPEEPLAPEEELTPEEEEEVPRESVDVHKAMRKFEKPKPKLDVHKAMRKFKKWDEDTSTGSPYSELRREGLSHDEAVARIEGRSIPEAKEMNEHRWNISTSSTLSVPTIWDERVQDSSLLKDTKEGDTVKLTNALGDSNTYKLTVDGWKLVAVDIAEVVNESKELDEILTPDSDNILYISKSAFADTWDLNRTRKGSRTSTQMFTFVSEESADLAGARIANAIGAEYVGKEDPRKAPRQHVEAKENHLHEMKITDGEGNEFDVYLVDDGSMDTVISISGMEFRFSSDFASMWRDEEGVLSEEGLRELALDALANMEEEDYNELIGRAAEEKAEVESEVDEKKKPPVCKKCGKRHWPFQKCKEAKEVEQGEAKPKEVKEEVEEGKDQPGVRDGTGPAKGSAQRSVSDVGRRKQAGEECPYENKVNEVNLNFDIDKMDLDQLVAKEDEIQTAIAEGGAPPEAADVLMQVQSRIAELGGQVEEKLSGDNRSDIIQEDNETRNENSEGDDNMDKKNPEDLTKVAEEYEAKAKKEEEEATSTDEGVNPKDEDSEETKIKKLSEEGDEKVEEKDVQDEKVEEGNINETDVAKGTKELIKLAKEALTAGDYGKAAEYCQKLAEIENIVPSEVEDEVKAEEKPEEPEPEVEESEQAAEDLGSVITDELQEEIEGLLDEGKLEEIDEALDEAAKKKGRPLKKGAAKRSRGDCVFQSTHSKVTDNADHFPINSENQARNALARANQYKSAPKWYKGSLDSLVKAVAKAVKKKYPDIEVSKAAERPGKDGKKESKIQVEDSMDISETKSIERLKTLLEG